MRHVNMMIATIGDDIAVIKPAGVVGAHELLKIKRVPVASLGQGYMLDLRQ